MNRGPAAAKTNKTEEGSTPRVIIQFFLPLFEAMNDQR